LSEPVVRRKLKRELKPVLDELLARKEMRRFC